MNVVTTGGLCGYQNPTSGTSMSFDSSKAAVSFKSEDQNDTFFKPGSYDLIITAIAGTTGDVTAIHTFTLTLECVILKEDFIWEVETYQEFDLVRKDYLANWAFPIFNLCLTYTTDPFYTDPSFCVVDPIIEYADFVSVIDATTGLEQPGYDPGIN